MQGFKLFFLAGQEDDLASSYGTLANLRCECIFGSDIV